jgi:hypothetical protein
MFHNPKERSRASKTSCSSTKMLEIESPESVSEKEAKDVTGKVMRMSEGESDALGNSGEVDNKRANALRRMADENPSRVNKMYDEDEYKKVNCMHEEDENKKVYKMHDEDENRKVNRMHEEDEGKKVHKMHDEEDKHKIMKKGEGGGGIIAPSHVEAGINNSKGNGQNLPGNVQKDLGGKMKADLSNVKIHSDSQAHEMSESINAKAFTHGQDIYFKNGNYNPDSSQGKELLAHELVHTQQQKSGVQRQKDETVESLLYKGKIANTTLAALRKTPEKTTTNVLADIPKDASVDVIDQQGGWLKVVWGDKVGYVSHELIVHDYDAEKESQEISKTVAAGNLDAVPFDTVFVCLLNGATYTAKVQSITTNYDAKTKTYKVYRDALTNYFSNMGVPKGSLIYGIYPGSELYDMYANL